MKTQRPVAVAAVALTLTVAASGCGGGSNSGTPSAKDLERCLNDKASIFTATLGSPDLDTIAKAAGDGGIYVDYGAPIPDLPNGNRANIAVERSSGDARRTEAAYRTSLVLVTAFPKSLMRKGKVVVAWDKSPTDAERSTIEDCL